MRLGIRTREIWESVKTYRYDLCILKLHNVKCITVVVIFMGNLFSMFHWLFLRLALSALGRIDINTKNNNKISGTLVSACNAYAQQKNMVKSFSIEKSLSAISFLLQISVGPIWPPKWFCSEILKIKLFVIITLRIGPGTDFPENPRQICPRPQIEFSYRVSTISE